MNWICCSPVSLCNYSGCYVNFVLFFLEWEKRGKEKKEKMASNDVRDAGNKEKLILDLIKL